MNTNLNTNRIALGVIIALLLVLNILVGILIVRSFMGGGMMGMMGMMNMSGILSNDMTKVCLDMMHNFSPVQ